MKSQKIKTTEIQVILPRIWLKQFCVINLVREWVKHQDARQLGIVG